MRTIHDLGDEQPCYLIEEDGELYFAAVTAVVTAPERPVPPAAQPAIAPRHLAWLTAITLLG